MLPTRNLTGRAPTPRRSAGASGRSPGHRRSSPAWAHHLVGPRHASETAGGGPMQASEASRAIAAARAIAAELGLRVEDTIVLQDSNRLTVRLLPCDVVARIAPISYRASAEFEVDLARQLAASETPVAALDPRVDPRVYER